VSRDNTDSGAIPKNTTIVGSVTNNDLVLITNNSERLRIDSSGNFGIGTTSPSAALHINSTNIPQFRVEGRNDRGGMIWVN
jgi:hypothetical protein